MDFLSDTARKEKRTLLATGSVGILVAWLNVDQTEIELAGFRFHNPNLPALIDLSLLAIIIYLLAKFCFSYFYERYHAEMKMYAAQISEGKTAMDINREEKEILEGSRLLIEQQRAYQTQQETEKEHIEELQAAIENNDRDHESALKLFDQQSSELQEILEKASGPHYVQIHSMNISTDPSQIPKHIEGVEERKAAAIINRHNARQRELDHLKDWVNRSEGNEKARRDKVRADEEAINAKRESVSRWRQAHRGATIVTPMHLFLDVGLPILVGLTAIGFLTWFLFYPPPPSIPPSLPEF